MTLLLSVVFLAYICEGYKIETKRLQDLSLDEYEDIFDTNYVDSDRKYASHDIHLVDGLGKFIKLTYESQHPSNTNILKLDEKLHSIHIQSLSCSVDNIKLKFQSVQIAFQYHQNITALLSDSHKRYFISGSHKWGCVNLETNQIHSILRKVTAVYKNGVQLTLSTQSAHLLDVFEELSISYESNSKHNHYKTESVLNTYSNQNKRRLEEGESIWRSMWPSMKLGLTDSITFIKDLVKDAGITGLAKAVWGSEVEFGPKSAGPNTWSWNYDDRTQRAVDEVRISDNVTCSNCYTTLDLQWKVQAVIKKRRLELISIETEGNMDTKMDIFKQGTYKGEQERIYRINQSVIPDISFSVAGVHFGMSIWGEVGVAMRSYLNYAFSVGIGAKGYIKKGISYSSNEQYNYVNEDHLDYDLGGPKIGFETGEMNNFMYIRPLLYIRMEHLADLYFGIQPTFELFVTNHEDLQTCVVHYAPSLNLNQFIGGDLALTKWKKEIDFGVYQSNIDTIGGCLSKADLVRHRIELPDVLMDENGDIFYDAYDEHYRRRLMNTNTDAIDTANYIDMSHIDFIPAFSNDDKWTTKGSLNWWGNMSTIHNLCDHWDSVCVGYNGTRIVPSIASLVISTSETDDSLIGIYRTEIEISPQNNWGFINTSMLTNISCTARHKFELIHDRFDNDDIKIYNITLLEWYCDTNVSELGIDKDMHLHDYAGWQCMISLPLQMKAIALDASFGSIILFDAGSWCHVFTLTTKPRYTFNASKIDWNIAPYPSSLWYGIWDCEEVFNEAALESRLYFISYDYGTLETEAILYLNTNSSFKMKGSMDLINMEMELVSVYWIEEHVFLNGSYDSYRFVGKLNLFEDGTIIYAGSIESSGCTGFLFQGFLNLTEFEKICVENETTTDFPINTNVTDVVILKVSDNTDSLWSKTSLIMFLVGAVTASMIFSGIIVVCIFRNKKMHAPKGSYELMNDAQL